MGSVDGWCRAVRNGVGGGIGDGMACAGLIDGSGFADLDGVAG